MRRLQLLMEPAGLWRPSWARDRSTDDPDRVDTDARIEVLRDVRQRRATTPTLVTAAGVVSLVSASADASAVEDASDGTRWVDVEARADRAPGLFLAGEIALGVGIAAIGAGLGW